MPDLTWDEDRELRAAFERDKWAGEWNSLPIAVERIVADRVARARAEALREAAEVMPLGYSHAAALLRERADRLERAGE